MFKKLFVMLSFFVVFLGLVSALNQIYISPSPVSTTQGQHFTIDINGIALANTSDVFGVQFDLDYNPSLLSMNSVTQGNFLKSDGATTIFNYTSSAGKLTVYTVRNTTTGIYGSGTFATVNFTALNSGNSFLNLSNVVWVNSTITNDSAETISLIVDNGSVIAGEPFRYSDLSFSPSSQQVGTGVDFDVNVTVSNVTELYGYQFDLSYNSSVLQYLGISQGPFLSSDGASVFQIPPNSGTPGFLDNYAVTRISTLSGINGSGVIAQIKFRSLSVGNSNFVLSNDLLYDSNNTNPQPIQHTTQSGNVTVISSFVCGNNVVEGTEQCDGTNLSSQTCITQGYTGGTLSCTSSCTFNVTACTTGSSSSGSSGGGGGGGSGGSVVVKSNSTNQTQVDNNIIENNPGNNIQSGGNKEVTGISDTGGNKETKGFLALTGNIIGRGAIAVIQSWAFYFILILSIIFVTVLLIRRQRKRRRLHRLLNHRHFGY
ncbi:MAG: cohesin domain-containing protein [Nanoarchaeota archaeon]